MKIKFKVFNLTFMICIGVFLGAWFFGGTAVYADVCEGYPSCSCATPSPGVCGCGCEGVPLPPAEEPPVEEPPTPSKKPSKIEIQELPKTDFAGIWGANIKSVSGEEGKIVTKSLMKYPPDGFLLKGFAENALAELGMTSDRISILGAVDLALDTDGLQQAYFEIANIAHGKKIAALVMNKDGMYNFVPAEVNIETGEVTVRLTGDATSIVFVEYLPDKLENLGAISNADLRQIFDAEYYAKLYPDLTAAFGNNSRRLFNHFVNFGLKEGRAACDFFDISFYMLAYQDLKTAGFDDSASFIKHYLEYGKSEGRLAGIN